MSFRLAALLMLSVGLAWTAQAFIPAADRTMKAIAEVNRSSKRSQALQLEVTMRIGDRGPVARGELISHPSGLARLELRRAGGQVVRYLLSGRELSGAEDGRRLDRPRPLLQPFFFLQPASEVTLRAALESFDVLSDSIGLATCGEGDCFVIGDPRLEAPLPEPIDPEGLEDGLGDPLDEPMDDATGLADTSEADPALQGPSLIPLEAEADEEGDRLAPRLALSEDALLPRVWVDTKELQVRRIDRASGVFTIFGPIVSFEKLLVPAWFEVHEPGTEKVRFEIDRAVAVNAPPQAFSRKWLLTPPATQPTPAPPSGRGAAADQAAPSAPAPTPGTTARPTR